MSHIKVITWADVPSYAYMAQNPNLVAQNGNDGMVLQPLLDPAGNPNTTANTFTWKMWGTEILPWSNCIPIWDGYNPIPDNALQHNFTRCNITPGIDWFDAPGIANVIHNFVQMAGKAKASYCPGLLIDNEHYTVSTNIFRYTDWNTGTYTYNQYKTQVYDVAFQLGLALWEAWPNINVLFTLGYSVFVDAGGPDQDKQYSLLPSFLDGIYDSTAEYPCVTITMLNGIAAGCKTEGCFETVVEKSSAPAYIGSSPYYNSRTALGLFMDIQYPPFDNSTPLANYFTPTGLTDAIVLGANYTDKYICIYSGEYSWVRPRPTLLLNSAYGDSIINAAPGLC